MSSDHNECFVTLANVALPQASGRVTVKNLVKNIAIAILLISFALTLFTVFSSNQTFRVYPLADGSTVTLRIGQSGQTLHFYHGEFWQRPFFKLFGTNIYWRLRGYEIAIPSDYSQGSVAVVLSHALNRSPAAKVWNRSVNLVAVTGDGGELSGVWAGGSFPLKGKLPNPELVSEENYWEFPVTEQKIVAFRCYLTNETSLPTIFEFVLPNKNCK